MNRLFYAAGLFTVIASTYSFGQTVVAQADIPFNFQMGQTSMPAGTYFVSEAGSLLTIRNAAGKPAAMVLTRPAEHRGKSAKPSLEFDRYGNDYFLANIWTAGSYEGRALPKSKREQELARRVNSGQTEDVALQAKNHPSQIK